MSNEPAHIPTVLFFGTPGSFSRLVLEALVDHAIPVLGIVHRTSPAAPTPITRLEPRAPVSPPLLNRSSAGLDTIPRFLVRDLDDPEVIAQLGELRPDVIVAGCFRLLIPGPIRSLASRAALNVHPSLLPRHRGPDPIFWTLHAGESETGVTIHELDDHFDTGPIVAQSRLEVAAGAAYEQIEADLARRGGALLSDLIQSTDWPVPVPQRSGEPLRDPVPGRADLEIDQRWSSDRASRFIHGCGRSHGPLTFRSRTGAMVRFHMLAAGPGSAQIELNDGVLDVQPVV